MHERHPTNIVHAFTAQALVDIFGMDAQRDRVAEVSETSVKNPPEVCLDLISSIWALMALSKG